MEGLVLRGVRMTGWSMADDAFSYRDPDGGAPRIEVRILTLAE